MTSRKCLPELLCGPFRRRVSGDVVMKNSSATQFHHDEHVEQRHLLPEEQILRRQRTPSPETHGEKAYEIEQNHYCCDEAMPESNKQTH